MPIWTSAALYEELRKLIPGLPGHCVRCMISLSINDVPRVTLITLASGGERPVEITQRFTLVPEGSDG
jgi:hypothetical protein